MQIQLTADNVEIVVGQLSNVVSVATDVEDQISDNAEIISEVLSDTTAVVASGNFSVDISVSVYSKYHTIILVTFFYTVFVKRFRSY